MARGVVMRWLGIWVALLAGLGSARAAEKPVVLELFTSLACSSSPPADRLLSRLAREPGVLALDLHVTYWNGLGWPDPYSLMAATARQVMYQNRFHLAELYTPQLVVNGVRQVVGSDAAAVRRAIAAVRAAVARHPPVRLSLARTAGGMVARIGPGRGPAMLWRVGYDERRVTAVGGGENAGRRLAETDVVREISPAASWMGAASTFVLARPAGQRAAVFLAAPDGRILAAATLARKD